MRQFESVPHNPVVFYVSIRWSRVRGAQKVAFEQTAEGKGDPRALGMSKVRFLFANGVIGFLIICSLIALAIDRQSWPFSNYPMFSYLAGDTGRDYSFSKAQLYGVSQEEPHQEFPLRGSYIEPFQEDRLLVVNARMIEGVGNESVFNAADDRIKEDPEKRQQLLNEAAREFLSQYETLRQAGRHDGPPLQGIRLYRLHWQLDPQAENVDQPDYRELPAEYERT